MTKVQIEFQLERPLDDALLDRVAATRAVYGVLGIRPTSDLKRLVVDYDASRLSPADVDGVLRRNGVPVKPQAPLAATS